MVRRKKILIQTILSLIILAQIVGLLPVSVLAARGTTIDNVKTDFGLRFDENGKFRIMQINDMSEEGTIDPRTLDMIQMGVSWYEPDLIVINGDVTFADSLDGNSNSSLLSLINQYKSAFGNTPFTLTFGNHDSEREEAPDRQAQWDFWVQQGALNPDNNFSDTNVGGVGTGCLPILASDSDKVAYNLVLLDSGQYDPSAVGNGDYVYAKPGYESGPNGDREADEAGYRSVCNWFRTMNEEMKLYTVDGDYAPTLAFVHIPLREFYTAGILKEVPADAPGALPGYFALDDDTVGTYIMEHSFAPNTENPTVTGEYNEYSYCSFSDTYELYKALADKGNVKGLFYAHEHMNTIMGEGTIFDKKDRREYTLVQGYSGAIDPIYFGTFSFRVYELSEDGSYTTQVMKQDPLKDASYYGTSYIGEIGFAYSGSSNPEYCKNYLYKRGFAVVDKDLNAGVQSAARVYMGYKTTEDATQAIRGILLYAMEAGSTPPPETLTKTVGNQRITYQIVTAGEDPRCDLNQGAASTHRIYAYVTRDRAAGEPIAFVDVDTGKKENGFYSDKNIRAAQWSNTNLAGKAANLNEGTGSDTYSYLVYGTNFASFVPTPNAPLAKAPRNVFLRTAAFFRAYEDCVGKVPEDTLEQNQDFYEVQQVYHALVEYHKANVTQTQLDEMTRMLQEDILCRVVFQDGAEVLESKWTMVGTTPVYTGSVPTKEETIENTYAFDGWTVLPAGGYCLCTKQAAKGSKGYRVLCPFCGESKKVHGDLSGCGWQRVGLCD